MIRRVHLSLPTRHSTSTNVQNGPSPICLCVSRQVTAQKNQWELDKLQTQSEMLKKFAIDEVDSHSKEGAYIVGLSMQGARWDPNAVSIEKSKARVAPCMLRWTRSFLIFVVRCVQVL